MSRIIWSSARLSSCVLKTYHSSISLNMQSTIKLYPLLTLNMELTFLCNERNESNESLPSDFKMMFFRMLYPTLGKSRIAVNFFIELPLCATSLSERVLTGICVSLDMATSDFLASALKCDKTSMSLSLRVCMLFPRPSESSACKRI